MSNPAPWKVADDGKGYFFVQDANGQKMTMMDAVIAFNTEAYLAKVFQEVAKMAICNSAYHGCFTTEEVQQILSSYMDEAKKNVLEETRLAKET